MRNLNPYGGIPVWCLWPSQRKPEWQAQPDGWERRVYGTGRAEYRRGRWRIISPKEQHNARLYDDETTYNITLASVEACKERSFVREAKMRAKETLLLKA